MSKKEHTAEYQEKYFAVLKKFNLTPDFKLSDYEKAVLKDIDKVGTITSFALADLYDLRPSEEKELLDGLAEKGVIEITEDNITLSPAAIKYIRAKKEDRKTEKKFRKFLNCLSEKDLDKFMELVNSFEVKDTAPEAIMEAVVADKEEK